MERIKRYHLMHDRVANYWTVHDTELGGIGSSSNGKLNFLNHEDVYQGDTLTELILNIYDSHDSRFYTVQDAILHDGTWRFDKYPMHCGIEPIHGICRTFFTRKRPGEWYYGFSFIGELWVREKSTIRKVHGFNMRKEKEKEIESYLKSVENGEKLEAEF